jgi:hypothetical protein
MASPAPSDIAKAVTFIFLADENGQPKINPQTNSPMPNGTGFFMLLKNESGPGGYGYIVTAKHVLLDQNGNFFRRVFIRLNDKNGGSQLLPLDLHPSEPNQNVFIHNDPTVDVAVIPGMPNETSFDFLVLPSDMVRTKEEFKKTTIVPGSDVFFTGLFTAYYGDKINRPIFRFGRVAMLPDERIRWQDNPTKPPELVELYLLETMSFGGNSGSPVFFSQGADRQPGSIFIGPPEITLAGIMRGNFNEVRAGGFVECPNAVLPIFGQNVGIAAVTPAYLLLDILQSEKLKNFRANNPIENPKAKENGESH